MCTLPEQLKQGTVKKQKQKNQEQLSLKIEKMDLTQANPKLSQLTKQPPINALLKNRFAKLPKNLPSGNFLKIHRKAVPLTGAAAKKAHGRAE